MLGALGSVASFQSLSILFLNTFTVGAETRFSGRDVVSILFNAVNLLLLLSNDSCS